MATTNGVSNGMTEQCDVCDTETLHEVSIQLVTEGGDEDTAQFSREPYRVRECIRCGHRDSKRMNNA
ncbi:DUF7835 family putative zinc beta-ribbon protein [Natronolimnohabitans innermongolicus]|uniref:DUF7835 domain-containing protein n=1 Tax=Natronolimnohabitans innermongolicus JCM 12255 TaxID=1227499 RepID=L9X755_9EURY|nr:hypothetical protein [Natronolimnohabitans innermongolicus]ELY57432.1 hypothetical protein C493_08101 [Natronolimnohabitans innermongolicus JCM 12255]